MIEHVVVDGQQINIGGACHAPFRDFFNIDSMGVLIGENGSGKTRALIAIAEMLSSGALHDGHYVRSYAAANRMRQSELAHGPAHDLGVVYYSAIPFRRKIRKAKTLIEESCIGTRVREPVKMNLFREIAYQLQPARMPVLTAYVGYSSALIQRSIYPILLERQVFLYDEEANGNLRRIRELKGIGVDAERPTGASDVWERAVERELRDRETVLFEFLSNWRRDTSQRVECLCALAALNKLMPSGEQGAKALVRTFLEQMGIASVTPAVTGSGRYPKLQAVAQETLSVLNRLQAMLPMQETMREISFEIADEYVYDDLCSRETAVDFRWENLSSGLLAIVEQFAALHLAIKKLHSRGCSAILVLLDEPDAFLHLDWQRRYVALLDKFLEDLKSSNRLDSLQVLIASHSPVVAADMPRNMVQLLGDRRAGGAAREAFKTFAAPIDDLIYQSFQSNSMGEYASKKIRDLHKSAKQGRLDERDRALIAEIGDEGLQRAILAASEGRDAGSGGGA